MTAPALLVLYGNSVFLAGLHVALSRSNTLEIITIEPDRSDAVAYIQALDPRAVIFDRSGAQPDFAISLLCDHPDLLLIGVDACSDRITILSHHKEHVSSIADLVDVIGHR